MVSRRRRASRHVLGPSLVALGLVTGLLATASSAQARSSLAPISSIHATALPPASTPSHDACTVRQFDNPTLPGVYDLVVRGFAVVLLAPTGWSCRIVDANGSAASILLRAPVEAPPSSRGSIGVDVSATALDSGVNFCPYWRRFTPVAGSCRGRNQRPSGEEVAYLLGTAASSRVAFLVADPTGADTPLAQRAPTPTITAVGATLGGPVYDLHCAVGPTVSPMCVGDAHRLASAFARTR